MASLMKFRFKRKLDTPVTHDPDAVGYEATVNVAGWPAPQVLAVPLDAETFGDFLGEEDAHGTREMRYVDNKGNKSKTPLVSEFDLPDTFEPATPEEAFEVELTGEEQQPSPPV